ncbi:MAG: indolepyruvate oxidoreductase subunit beta [Desulfurococcales archaeon]|nr:indolepyruvate oxidoreductase subunit beta [Desulfurococcales archaeon]
MGKPERLNILVVGVGGQGLITMSNTLARAALLDGTKALVAETHGLSQRGGSVEVHVRLGDVYAPLIPEGGADVIVALELIEAARAANNLKNNGTIVANDRIIRPAVPNVEVPEREELLEYLKQFTKTIYLVDAYDIASKVGSTLSQNMVVLGTLMGTGLLEGFVSIKAVEKIISTLRRAELNLEAFRRGLTDFQRI